MVLEIHIDATPLRTNDGGTVYIGQSRVTLTTVIAAFHRGDSPEQIVDSFDVLSLADVYAVIAYYLKHRDEVDAYIKEQDNAATQLRQDLEIRQPDMFSLRQRLLQRKPHQSS